MSDSRKNATTKLINTLAVAMHDAGRMELQSDRIEAMSHAYRQIDQAFGGKTAIDTDPEGFEKFESSIFQESLLMGLPEYLEFVATITRTYRSEQVVENGGDLRNAGSELTKSAALKLIDVAGRYVGLLYPNLRQFSDPNEVRRMAGNSE